MIRMFFTATAFATIALHAAAQDRRLPVRLSRQRRILRADIGPGVGRGARDRAMPVELDAVGH